MRLIFKCLNIQCLKVSQICLLTKVFLKKTKKIIEMCPKKKIQRSPSNVLSKKGCHTKEMCPKKEEVSLSISKCAPKKWQQKHRKFLSNVPKQKKIGKKPSKKYLMCAQIKRKSPKQVFQKSL